MRDTIIKNQETRGKVTKLKGRLKEATGILSGDRKLENEGSSQRIEGAIEEGIGTARRKVGKLLGDLGKKIKN